MQMLYYASPDVAPGWHLAMVCQQTRQRVVLGCGSITKDTQMPWHIPLGHVPVTHEVDEHVPCGRVK
jgi:hypothetical protein